MSRIQELLSGRTDSIDYDQLLARFPWIIEKNMNCIISPDSDGLLCALFMSHYLGWSIKGFYDGKVMLLDKGTNAQDCVFLDMEIFRENIRSIGHHMVLYNKNDKPNNWPNFSNCIQPNIFRDYDQCHDFRLKYPLATIHLLVGIVGSKIKLSIPESAICPLFFTDGTFNVLFSYPENVLNWLGYLNAHEEPNPLKFIFENEKYSTFTLMRAMDEFFRQRDEISAKNERGDRLRISTKDGVPFNIVKAGKYYSLKEDTTERIVRFIKLLSGQTGWEYDNKNWAWHDLKLYKFRKGIIENLNNKKYLALMKKSPLSVAMTRGKTIEFTLEAPDKIS